MPCPFQIHIVPQENEKLLNFKILFEDRNSFSGFLKIASSLLINSKLTFKHLGLWIKDPKVNDTEVFEILERLNDSFPKSFFKQPLESFSIEISMQSCKSITYVCLESLVTLPLMSFVKSMKFFDLTISDKLITNLISKGSRFVSVNCLSFKKCSNISSKGVSQISKTLFLRNLKVLHLSRTSITDEALKALSSSSGGGECDLEEIDLRFSES